MRIPLVLFTLSAVLLGPRSAPAVHAFDATGHWTGKWSCKGFSAPFTSNGKLVNKFTSSNSSSTLDVTQSGPTFAAIIDAGQPGGSFTYNAIAVPDAKKADNGNIILLGCHLGPTLPSSPLDAELVQASVKTKTGIVKASFKATSIFADDFPESGICKYSYKRVDLTDQAGATTCP